MRIDHHAYQRATRVAGVGFLIQLGLGLTLLIFSLWVRDTALLFSSMYVLLGLLVWLGLIVIFNQHKLERLEALEEDELSAARPGSAFEEVDEEIRVAARRLRLMHKWLIPALSLLIAAALGGMWFVMFSHMRAVLATEAEFHMTEHLGWAVAICLSFSALSFIVSRFVAGMAKQEAWQNLRGGAAWMVGNALVTLAVAVGIGFRFFKNDAVLEGIAWALPWIMTVLALEIVLNFILNLYRPRIPGEVPRPAFDSKLLSLFAAPDNIIRTIGDAVNYQFGFDVTSSWGYKLLLRSVAWLLVLGIVVIVALNMMVIVEPHQMGIKLARGQMIGEPIGSGILWKAPWPIQTAELYDVTSIRQIHLTPHRQVGGGGPDGKGPWTGTDGVQLWTDDLSKRFDKPPHPFIVGGYRAAGVAGELEVEVDEEIAAAGAATGAEDREARRLATAIALIDSEVILAYRIKGREGLMQFLDIASGNLPRDRRLSISEEVLRQVALREVSRYMANLSLSEVFSVSRLAIASALRDRIQEALDRNRMGVEAVAVNVTLLRPAGAAAGQFEEFSVANQNRLKTIKDAEQAVVAGYADIVGDAERVEPIIAGIERWEQLQEQSGPDATETLEAREEAERMLLEAGGKVAQLIAKAERDRWVRLIDAMAQAKHLEGQLKPYRAASRLYRQREIMRLYAGMLPGLYKYVLGIDPQRVDFSIELRELTGLFNIQDAIKDEEGESSQ